MNNRIVLFPGLGADKRVFDGIQLINDAVCINYNKINFNQDIELVINDITDQYLIEPSDIIISTSFGGFLAGFFKNNHISLGGLLDKSELSIIFKFGLILRIYQYLPISIAPKFILKYFFGIRHKQTERLFFEMLNQYSHTKISSMLNLVNISSFAHQSTLRIHGQYDKIISKPINVKHWNNFGHITSMQYHTTKEMTDLIQKEIEKYDS